MKMFIDDLTEISRVWYIGILKDVLIFSYN